MDLERKFLDVKAEDITDEGEFMGYASIYGNEDLGGDIIEKGAFDNTLTKKSEVPMLWQHDMRTPIGKFLLEDDVKGLKAFGKINLATEKGKEAHALLKNGDIKGLSIGYKTIDYEFEKDGWTRRLKELELFEVSVVTFPMNTEANVDLASVKQAELDKEKEEQEKINKEQELKNQEFDALVDINTKMDMFILEQKIKNFNLH